MDLNALETELKKRHQYRYQWLRKQNDKWDAYSNFIYNTESWEELISRIKEVHETHKLDKNEIFQYAANRWYNFHSARAVEQIFCTIKHVLPAEEKDREKDFFIGGIPFDHKTSVFPQRYGNTLQYARSNKIDLIRWLYENQSGQQRFHLKNRIFLIVYKQDLEHWKLKADLTFLKNCIESYFEHFRKEQLHSINFGDETALSDIIWAVK